MPSPLTVTFVQPTVLNIIPNILAQLIDQRKSTVPSIDDIVLENFPVPDTNYRQTFPRHSIAEFDYTFDKPARLIGLPKAVLYISCGDRDDFTVIVILRKKDRDGNILVHLNFPFHATPVTSIRDILEAKQASLKESPRAETRWSTGHVQTRHRWHPGIRYPQRPRHRLMKTTWR
ncbi:hypothetical protein VN97_g2431 [Penicillium thymicola]|uniref:Xaa-Pro dipeptidyl-peptidase C-terminal domain-containing protein n=1 Tax=Penicillium thymicola TaxID=293382 RepID=A0AAI9TP05_PENTH|nr:hypothetical protein VN97_g2431 [Penicillium thymicola]